jgi:hypothetical protein
METGSFLTAIFELGVFFIEIKQPAREAGPAGAHRQGEALSRSGFCFAPYPSRFFTLSTISAVTVRF